MGRHPPQSKNSVEKKGIGQFSDSHSARINDSFFNAEGWGMDTSQLEPLPNGGDVPPANKNEIGDEQDHTLPWGDIGKLTKTFDQERAIKELAELLTKEREQAGLTKVAVAAAMGVAESRVRQLEKGTNSPQLDSLLRFAEAIGKKVKIEFVEIEGP